MTPTVSTANLQCQLQKRIDHLPVVFQGY